VRRHLKILILVPTTLPRISGNAITAERWRQALIRKGLNVHVLATEELDSGTLLQCIENLQPDVIHAHHVSRAGVFMLDPRIVDRYPGLPLVVSPAGTDLFVQEGHCCDRGSVVPRVCRKASVIVTQSKWTSEKLSELFPDVQGRIVHVPKAFSWFGKDKFELREATGWQQKEVIFFHPAGIRPVKRILETLQAFKEIHSVRTQARLVFAGPPLDQDYTAIFQEELERCSAFARWIPVIPHGAMYSAYEAADVVVNASSSEGLSNALLEAIAAGRPILASDIPGNKWQVMGETEKSPCGLLFNVDECSDFVKKAIKLIDDDGLRSRLGKTGRERAASWPGPDEEAGSLIHAYRQAIERQREALSS
jgi:L-malate glycosyltransferase